MKVKKKPIILDAWELVKNYEEVEKPSWVEEALENNELFLTGSVWYIDTLEGVMNAKIGDILIQGVEGEIYACDIDIFTKTYDVIDE